MEINTKFDVGQKVWYDYQGLACWDIIEGIRISLDRQAELVIQYIFHQYDPETEYWFTENNVFATREEWERNTKK